MNTSQIGERAEGAVLAGLLKAGYFVLTPFGASRRYDLVIERDGTFSRIQVKHGVIRNGAIIFRTASSRGQYEKRVVKSYVDEVEFFGVYASEIDTTYLVPVGQVGAGSARLRIEPSRNKQEKNVRWAKDFVLNAAMA